MPTEFIDDAGEPVRFDGDIGDFLGIAIVNLLLTIVTLGIYRFWGKTRVRKYLWEKTLFQGEPLEYFGKGSEKFVGALLVGVIFGGVFFVFTLISTAFVAAGLPFVSILLAIALYIGLFWLLGVGLYRSQRYMFSRTAWRGIRGGMVTGGWAYGGLYLKTLLLSAVTLGFASPYVATRLWNARMNDTRFGSAALSADANWRTVYGKFLFAWIAAVVIYVVMIAVIVTQFSGELATMKPGVPPADPSAVIRAVLVIYGVAIVGGVAIALIMLRYYAAMLQELFGSTRLETLGFSFSATSGDLLKFYLINLVLLVFTLGFGTIVMPYRTWSFYVRHLATTGHLDADALMQTSLTGPTQGDGIADAFDVSPF